MLDDEATAPGPGDRVYVHTRSGPGREGRMRQPGAGGPTSAESFAECLADQPGLPARLLAEHVPDAGGRHCRVCGGPQSGRQRWPCNIHQAAEAARKLVDERARR